jgi:hypothetical protein
MLEDQLSDPNFIEELEQACRDYEMDVYGNTKATEWGWKSFRPELLERDTESSSPPAVISER